MRITGLQPRRTLLLPINTITIINRALGQLGRSSTDLSPKAWAISFLGVDRVLSLNGLIVFHLPF